MNCRSLFNNIYQNIDTKQTDSNELLTMLAYRVLQFSHIDNVFRRSCAFLFASCGNHELSNIIYTPSFYVCYCTDVELSLNSLEYYFIAKPSQHRGQFSVSTLHCFLLAMSLF